MFYSLSAPVRCPSFRAIALSVGLFLSLACGSPALFSQQSQPQQPPPPQPQQPAPIHPAAVQTSDDVIVMSEFAVSSTKDKNYVASESITGTRVAAKIRDLPFVVNAITSEFLLDFAAFDMDAQLGWIANVSPSDAYGSLILRGFSSTPYVDGFRRLGPLDIVDTDRIEIIKVRLPFGRSCFSRLENA